MNTRTARAKLSTTVAPENYEYLTRIVKLGKAGSMAEVVDQAIENFRRAQNRPALPALPRNISIPSRRTLSPKIVRWQNL